jgi:ribosome-associated heat shock protein Hsp15
MAAASAHRCAGAPLMARGVPHADADHDASTPAGTVRLDKWLWAARFFKTRALAADAIDGGKVTVNDERPKRAKLVKAADVVTVRVGPVVYSVVVRDVSARRTAAAIAQALYEETPASVAARARAAELARAAAVSFVFPEGKPSKKDRRAIDRARDRR